MQRISDIVSFSKEEKTLDVYIEGVIGFENDTDSTTTKEQMKAELSAFNSIDKDLETINLHIDSPGGSVTHALSMYNALASHNAVKHVYYTGVSASAATILGAVARSENVHISEYLTLLIHEARYTKLFATETAQDLKIQIDDLNLVNRNIAKIYSNQNGLTIDENLEIMGDNGGEGRVLSADEAKELGFVGNVKKLDMKIAAFDMNKLKESGWTSKQILELNNKTMSLFKKKEPLKSIETESGIIAYRTLEEGKTVEFIGNENSVNGVFEIEGKTVEVENGTIKTIADTAKKEVSAIDRIEVVIQEICSRLDAMEEAQAKSTDDKSEQVIEGVNNLTERVNAVEDVLLKAKFTSSNLKPDEPEFIETEVKKKEETIHQKARRLQNEKLGRSL